MNFPFSHISRALVTGEMQPLVSDRRIFKGRDGKRVAPSVAPGRSGDIPLISKRLRMHYDPPSPVPAFRLTACAVRQDKTRGALTAHLRAPGYTTHEKDLQGTYIRRMSSRSRNGEAISCSTYVFISQSQLLSQSVAGAKPASL